MPRLVKLLWRLAGMGLIRGAEIGKGGPGF